MNSETLESSSLNHGDPSFSTGSDVIYDMDTPLTYKEGDEKEIENVPFHFRVITYGNENAFNKVRFEVTMEGDLFLFFYCEFDREKFKQFSDSSGISCPFNEFHNKIIEYMEKKLRKDPNYLVILSPRKDGSCVLSFRQILAIKEVEIVVLELSQESDDFVNRQIQFRFDLARHQLKQAKNQMDGLYKMKSILSSSPVNKSQRSPGSKSSSPSTPLNKK